MADTEMYSELTKLMRDAEMWTVFDCETKVHHEITTDGSWWHDRCMFAVFGCCYVYRGRDRIQMSQSVPSILGACSAQRVPFLSAASEQGSDQPKLKSVIPFDIDTADLVMSDGSIHKMHRVDNVPLHVFLSIIRLMEARETEHLIKCEDYERQLRREREYQSSHITDYLREHASHT